MKNSKDSISIRREALLKNLFLYVVSIRDLEIAQKTFDDIKDIDIGFIADPNVIAKTYVFIISYGRIFLKSHNLGQIKFNSL